MSVSGKDFLEFAEFSLDLDTEIGFRNSVSRAYYSIYHTVLDIIEGNIPNYSGGGSHSSLIKYLEDSSNPEKYDKRQLKRLSYILKQQRDLRCDADYELDIDIITKATANDSIKQAHRIADICSELLNAAA